MAWYEVKKGGSSPAPTPANESYIYALGNIGFNTGYIHTANTKIRFKASINTLLGQYTQVFGARNGSFRANAFTFFGRANFDGYALCRSGSEVRGNTIAEDSAGSPWNQTPCIFTAEGTEISWYREFDPNTVRRIQGSGTIDGGIAPLAIYCCNSTTAAGGWAVGDYITDMRLFWFEIYESNTLIHRFVPAFHNNQWCLYDEVDEDYIYDVVSNGANVRGFLGSIVPATKYESYIYNVGNCAFNTGYNHKTTTKVKFKASIDAISGGWRQLWGHDQNGWRNNAFESAMGDNSQLALVLKNGWGQGDQWTAAESSTSALWSNVPCIFETNGTTISWYRESDPNTVRSLSPSGSLADAIAPMAIFRNNSASTADGWTIGGKSAFMRLFWFEIYEGSTLLHRFVPAYNNSQWCLYDEVDEVYIYDVEYSGANLRGWLAS